MAQTGHQGLPGGFGKQWNKGKRSQADNYVKQGTNKDKL